MKTQLYFWKPLMRRFKDELSLVESYYERTKPNFENIEEEAQEHADKFYNNYPATEETDPYEIMERSWEVGQEYYDTLNVMKANHLLMTHSMLYHIWEQQVIKFAIKETEKYLNYKQKSLTYGEAVKMFQVHGVEITKTVSWEKIKELKWLVNTIKHAEGHSSNKLRKVRPDFFLSSGVDSLALNGSVLTNPFALNVGVEDLYDYIETTKNFWDEMPERAYSDKDKIFETFFGKKL